MLMIFEKEFIENRTKKNVIELYNGFFLFALLMNTIDWLWTEKVKSENFE